MDKNLLAMALPQVVQTDKLTVIKQKNQQELQVLLARKDSMPSEITEITSVMKALLAPNKVCDCTDHEIIKTLKILYAMVGLRKQHFPSEDKGGELMLLINFIRDQYKQKTLNEIVMAFQMAMHGVLDIDLDEVNPYDQFSCLYVAKIMNAWRKYVLKIRQNKETIKSTPLEIEDKKEVTTEDWDQWLADCKNIHFDLLPVLIFDHFEESKKMVVTNELKNEAIKYYSAKLAGDVSKEGNIRYKLFTQMREQKKYSGDILDMLIIISKRLAIRNFLSPPAPVVTIVSEEKKSTKKVK